MAKPATKPKVDIFFPSNRSRPPSHPGPATTASSPDELKAYYRDMLLIRRFEERAGQLYGMGLIGGFCHLYIGQEAVVVGMQASVRDKDAVITSYRDHGHMLACGMDPKGVMAELTGRSGGYSKGKGGSMHMFSREKSFYGGHGIVGAQVPIGTGLAFAHKYNGDKNVSLTYFGDGSANQGQVYEAMNMAALWKLPVVYIIENNHYGMGTSVERASADDRALPPRRGLRHSGRAGRRHGRAGGARGRREGHRACAQRAGPLHPRDADLPLSRPFDERSGQVPDQGRGRQVSATSATRSSICASACSTRKIVDEAALKAIDAEIRKIVNDAAEFAQHSPEPDPSELWTDILVESLSP